MGEEFRLLFGPAVFVTMVLLLVLYDRLYHRSHHAQRLTKSDYLALHRELTDLTATMDEFEAEEARTGRELRLLKKLVKKVENHAEERKIFRKMCGIFTPCANENERPLPLTTPKFLGRLID